MMKQRIVMMMAAVIMLSGVAQAKTYKIGMVRWAGYSPANVADAKGIWKAAGLDVAIFMLNGNADVHQALAQKRIDFAVDITGFWADMFMDGIPVTVLAEIDWSNGGDKILLRKGVDPANLKGKIVGTYDMTSASLLMVHKYLSTLGLKVSDVKRVEFPAEDMPEDFLATQMPMAVCYDPYALKIEQAGAADVVASSATYPGSIADSIVMLTEVLNATPREDVVKFLRGWVDAVAWLENPANWTEYAAILNQKTFEANPPMSDAELRQVLSGVRIHNANALRINHQPGGSVFTYCKELRDVLAENQALKKEFAPEDLVDASFLLEALPPQE